MPDDRLRVVFEDLLARFILNVPSSELASTDRICFQIEQAHWFYEDFLRDPEQPAEDALPGFTLKRFTAQLFTFCPVLNDMLHGQTAEDVYKRFVAYKLNVPVCGAIILNQALDKVLLVRGWSTRSGWMFPKGKINQNEPETKCAAREVMEEIGFDVSALIQENDYIEHVIRGEQRNRMYIVPNISETTPFETQTRKEISEIKWHRLSELQKLAKDKTDSKFYMIRRFIADIFKWVNKYKKQHPHLFPRRSVQQQKNMPVISETEHSTILKGLLGIATPSQSVRDDDRMNMYGKSAPVSSMQSPSSAHGFSSPQQVMRGFHVQTPPHLDDQRSNLLSLLNSGTSKTNTDTKRATRPSTAPLQSTRQLSHSQSELLQLLQTPSSHVQQTALSSPASTSIAQSLLQAIQPRNNEAPLTLAAKPKQKDHQQQQQQQQQNRSRRRTKSTGPEVQSSNNTQPHSTRKKRPSSASKQQNPQETVQKNSEAKPSGGIHKLLTREGTKNVLLQECPTQQGPIQPHIQEQQKQQKQDGSKLAESKMEGFQFHMDDLLKSFRDGSK